MQSLMSFPVISSATGKPCALTAKWILLVLPTRLLPMAPECTLASEPALCWRQRCFETSTDPITMGWIVLRERLSYPFRMLCCSLLSADCEIGVVQRNVIEQSKRFIKQIAMQPA